MLKTVGTVMLLNDPHDLAVAVLDAPSPTDQQRDSASAFKPDLVLYDTYPGGIGQSQPLFNRRRELLTRALDLVLVCRCEQGCPACVGPRNEVGAAGKALATAMLKRILETSSASGLAADSAPLLAR